MTFAADWALKLIIYLSSPFSSNAQIGTLVFWMKAVVRLSKGPKIFSRIGVSHADHVVSLSFRCVGQSCKRRSAVSWAVPHGHMSVSPIMMEFGEHVVPEFAVGCPEAYHHHLLFSGRVNSNCHCCCSQGAAVLIFSSVLFLFHDQMVIEGDVLQLIVLYRNHEAMRSLDFGNPSFFKTW